MYKSRKGKSGSTKPYVSEAPEWSNTDTAAVTQLVIDLGKEGHSTAMIGTILRDQHAVPNARLVLGKRIGAVLAENNIGGTYPEDMMNLMRQAVGIINHISSGNHKVLWFITLYHLPHTLDIIAGMSPITLRVQVT